MNDREFESWLEGRFSGAPSPEPSPNLAKAIAADRATSAPVEARLLPFAPVRRPAQRPTWCHSLLSAGPASSASRALAVWPPSLDSPRPLSWP